MKKDFQATRSEQRSGLSDMGRIKNTGIKTLGTDIIKKNPDAFSTEFAKNKEALKKVTSINSKKIRNVLAGYVTSEMKKRKKV